MLPPRVPPLNRAGRRTAWARVGPQNVEAGTWIRTGPVKVYTRFALDSAIVFTDGLVNLYTRDIEAGIRFYRDLLGLKETFRTPKTGVPTHVEFKVGGFTLGLGTVEAAKRVHGVDATPGSPGAALVFWTGDVDRTFERLVAAGVPAMQPPHDTGNNNRNAQLRDPDGNVVEIVSKRA